MNTNELFLHRAMALRDAARRARNPQWRILWARKLEQLVENRREEIARERNDSI